MIHGGAERHLLGLAMAMGAGDVPGWSDTERELVADLPIPSESEVREAVGAVAAGRDVLGEMLCRIRSPRERRPQGATYTPLPIVGAMVTWAERHVLPARVIDPGAGTGRFAVAAARRFRGATLVAVELDPVPAILCRGHLAAAGMAGRSHVLTQDYRRVELEPLGAGQQTLFMGNPPYVRHHGIGPEWKAWLTAEGRRRGLKPSTLAGLHVHFFLATANLSREGDVACFITSAEWLDVNYGRMVRELLLNGLGMERLLVLEPTAEPFPDAQTTAAIVCMEVGARSNAIRVGRVDHADNLGDLRGGRRVRRERFEIEHRWSRLTRRARKAPEGFVELGEFCRVHRGTATGANRVWIAGEHACGLPPEMLRPAVTKARELYDAGEALRADSGLRRVIDLPANLDELDSEARAAAERFLRFARECGAHESYIARHRKPWWAIRLRSPAPILATYMARRAPAFVRNIAEARHLNIAHGLYPMTPMDDAALENLVAYLHNSVNTADGRTYAGGLPNSSRARWSAFWCLIRPPSPQEYLHDGSPAMER